MPSTSSQRGWARSYFKFSLRLLLVVITIFGLWLAVLIRQAKHEREARRAVAPLARVIHYDFQVNADGKFLPDAEPVWGNWIRETIGDEYFYCMHTVMFSDDVTDSDLVAIKDALKGSSLQSISLAPCRQISDEGLSVISELEQLRELDLRGTAVTNKGLERLVALTNLRELQLGAFGFRRPTLVNDEGLKALARMPQLQSLFLFGDSFTDAGLAHLNVLPDLRVLFFQRTGVSREALAHLRRHNQLEVLALVGCDVRDVELRDLLAFPNLKRLYLDSPNVTDASVETLTQLRRLESLSVGKTGMTTRGLAELQKALPNCKIR